MERESHFIGTLDCWRRWFARRYGLHKVGRIGGARRMLLSGSNRRKILSAGRLHDGRPERKAESQDISGSALEHETAFGYGVSFDGERKLSRDARPNRPAMEARRSLGGRNFPGRTVGESTSGLL